MVLLRRTGVEAEAVPGLLAARRLVLLGVQPREGDTPRSGAPVSRDSLPKAPKAALPRKVPPTDRHGVKYKAPPVPAPPVVRPEHQGGRGPAQARREGTAANGDRKPPQAGLSRLGEAGKTRRERRGRSLRRGRLQQWVLASRTEATIVFDWRQVLEKAWIENRGATWETKRGSHGYFNVDLAQAAARCDPELLLSGQRCVVPPGGSPVLLPGSLAVVPPT